MALTSQIFRGNNALEACAVKDPAHITIGATGDHVAKIQFALFTLDRRMHLMDVGVLAVIHTLAEMTLGPALVHFFSSLAGAGDDAGAGDEAGADVSFASFSSWDWSSDIK